MSGFSERPFAARFGAMGDESEAMFEQVHDGGKVAFGLRRPPVNLAGVSSFVRYTPDYLTNSRLVECMGIGRDCVLKLKIEKLQALQEWDRYHPVWLFIWDSSTQRHTEQTIWEVAKQCNAHAEMQRFPEGKPAWFLHIPSMFHWSWTEADSAAA